MEGTDVSTPSTVPLRKFLCKRFGQRRHLCLRLNHCYMRLQSPEYIETPATKYLSHVRWKNVRRPNIRRCAGKSTSLEIATKTTRHYSNDRLRPAIHPNGTADNVRITAKAAPPEVVSENHDARHRSAIFFGC